MRARKKDKGGRHDIVTRIPGPKKSNSKGLQFSLLQFIPVNIVYPTNGFVSSHLLIFTLSASLCVNSSIHVIKIFSDGFHVNFHM